MLLPKLSCVYIPCIKSVSLSVCLAKVLFLAFFGGGGGGGGPYMITEMGMVIYMYLKHSPDYINSKYIWVHGSNSLGSNVSAEIPFFAFTGKGGVARWKTAHVTTRVKL